MTAQGRTHATALAAYVSACTFGLLFCLTRGQAAAGSGTPLPVTVEKALGGGTTTVGSPNAHHGLVGVLEALLQTQLGVFVFANFVIACCAAIAAITTNVFLESLTPSEAGRLTQRLLKYLLFKVALVGMVVLPSEAQLLHWLPWLAIIGEMKMFVGLAKDRLAGLSVTPAVGLSRHVRTLCLLVFILASNALGLALLHRQQGALSWAVRLLFALDLGIISVEATKAALSCVCLLMDEALAVSTPSLQLSATLSGRAMSLWDSWQGKGRERFFYHSELLADVAVHLLTLLHHVYVWLLHGMSFNLLDALLLLDTRVVLTSFVQRVKAHMMHRAATHSLDHSFPDATEKLLLASDAECAICRDKLSAAKQLPCGHLFHLPCLRAWLQQSGHDNFKCPICRRALCVQVARCPEHSDGRLGAGLPGVLHWRAPGRQPAGLMGHWSLSMSYNDLTAAARDARQVSLEEQMLREVGAGFGEDDRSGSTDRQQLLAAAGSLGSVGSENFDALLAQALAASLQTANLPAGGSHVPDTQEDGAESAQELGSAGMEAAAELPAAADSDSSISTSDQGQADLEIVEQGQSTGAEQGAAASMQQLWSDSSCAGSVMRVRRRRACRTTSLPLELLTFDCCCKTGPGHVVCTGGAAQQQDGLMQHGQLVDGADAAAWSDPLSDSDVLPSSRRSVRDTCSRMLASWIHTSHSKHSGGASSSKALHGTEPHAASLSRSADIHNGAYLHLHRHSRSCGHLDALGDVGSWSASGEQGRLGAGLEVGLQLLLLSRCCSASLVILCAGGSGENGASGALWMVWLKVVDTTPCVVLLRARMVESCIEALALLGLWGGVGTQGRGLSWRPVLREWICASAAV